MFLILQTDIYPVQAMRCKGTSFCISQPRLAIIEPSYNRVTKLELEFSASQNVSLDISMRVQNYKARSREGSSEQYTPLLHMENYLFYWTFSNYAMKQTDEMDAVRAHLGLMLGWLTKQGKEKLVDKCFIAGKCCNAVTHRCPHTIPR